MMTRSKTQALALLDEIDVNRVREFPPETVNVNATDENMDTRLHIAAQNFTSDAINNFIKEFSKSSVYAKYPDASKILEIIKMWIRGGADIVDVLLQRGASVNAKNKYKCTPLHKATIATTRIFDIAKGFHRIWPNIELKEHFENSVSEIIDETDIRIVKLLLSNGADVNPIDEYGMTPLHRAAASDKPNIVKLLLDYGANVNAQNEFGKTPLYRAVEWCRTRIVKLLLDHGADVNVENIDARTPLHEAAKIGSTSLVEMLLDRGAHVNAKDGDGITALHLIRYDTSPAEFKDILNLLLQHGADLESRDYRGRTLAHLVVDGIFFSYALQKRISYELLLNMVNEVFSHGVDVNAADKYGETPYTLVLRKIKNLSKRNLDKIRNSASIDHIRKLVALGAIHMAEKNRPLFFDIMNASIKKQINLMQKPHQMNPRDPEGDGHDYYGKCVHEVNILKTFQLSQNITLADVLTLEDPMKLASISQTIFFQGYAKSVDLDNKFPIYAFVINHQYERGLDMKLLCEKCEISLKIISSGKLNRDCAQEVLQHLSAIELKNLSETINL